MKEEADLEAEIIEKKNQTEEKNEKKENKDLIANFIPFQQNKQNVLLLESTGIFNTFNTTTETLD